MGKIVLFFVACFGSFSAFNSLEKKEMECLKQSHWAYYNIKWDDVLKDRAMSVLYRGGRGRREAAAPVEKDVEFETTINKDINLSSSWNKQDTLVVAGLCRRYFNVKLNDIQAYQHGRVGCAVKYKGARRVKTACHYTRY